MPTDAGLTVLPQPLAKNEVGIPSPSMPSRRHHIPFLDGCRGIAVLAVFLFHSLGAAYGWDMFAWKGLFRDFEQPRSLLVLFPLTYGGTIGVAVFFVISGFCIHLSHKSSGRHGWMFFFWRRLFRIYPAYLLCLFFFFFLWPWAGYSLGSPSDRISLLSHIFAVHNLIYDAKFTINPSFWSIAAEIQLYLLYPLLVLVTALCGWRRSLILLFGTEVLIRLMDFYFPGKSFPHYWISNSPLGFWFSWSLGAYLAECRLKGRLQVLASVSLPLVALLAFASPQFRPTASLDFPLFALLAAMIIDRLLARQWSQTAPEGWRANLWKHLSLLGVVSYSFYLIHQPVVDAIKTTFLTFLGPGASPLSVFSSCLLIYPFLLLASWLMFRWVETPFLRYGQRLWGRLSPSGRA